MGEAANDAHNSAFQWDEDTKWAIRQMHEECPEDGSKCGAEWTDDWLIRCPQCGKTTDI